MDWSTNGWQSAFRIELRVQAIGLASRGWPVFPGTYPVDSRWVGRTESEVDGERHGPTPVHHDWQDRFAANPEQAASWWSHRSYSLLLATGGAVDAIEVREGLGNRAASALRSLGFPVPIVATPDGRWYFLTSGGHSDSEPLCPELADSARLHSTGSWVPMPPTTFPHGVVHWRVKPEVCGWRLPASDQVQEALCAGMHQHEDVANLVAASR